MVFTPTSICDQANLDRPNLISPWIAAMGIDTTEQPNYSTISGDLISSFNWAKILTATCFATSIRSDKAGLFDWLVERAM